MVDNVALFKGLLEEGGSIIVKNVGLDKGENSALLKE